MKRLVVIVGMLGVLITLLVMGAFVGGRLLSAPEQAADGDDVRIVEGEGGSASVSHRVWVKRAAELPDGSPEAAGLLTEQEDNRLFVGTGIIRMTVDEDGREHASHDGPLVEVVATHNTKVYREVQEGQEVASALIQQKVAPGSLAELELGSLVSVWGERRGDRVIADVLVFNRP